MIFYFSGTGNTRWAAEHLAAATQDRLLFIPDELHGDCTYTLDDNERIGFCFPVHGWMPPGIVREFIRKLTLTNANEHYLYVLCTCGDDIGQAMRIFRQDLHAKGLKIDSAFSIIMPESYVCLPGFNTDTDQKARAKVKHAAEDLSHYISLIKERQKGVTLTFKGRFPWTKTYLLGMPFNRFMITDRPFRVDSSRCRKCGACARACPVHNIAWQKGSTPSWLHDGTCTNCLACYHTCPAHAIDYGRQTKCKGQYKGCQAYL